MRKTALLFSALALMGLGCDDSSSNHHYEEAPTHFQIRGKISDPAVKGAKLELFDNQNNLYSKCGVNGNTLCNVWSKEDGSFIFTLPIGTDVTDFSIKSLGGEDSAYGYELPISYFLDIDNFSNNKTNMIVSPFTSLAYHLTKKGDQEQAAKEKIAKSFGVSQDIIFQDPESNAELIKWGYIITNIASEKGGLTPMEDIAKAIERRQGALTDDAVMHELLSDLFGSSTVSINKIKSIVKTIKSIQTADPKSAIESVKKEEKTRIFLSAFAGVFEGITGDLSADAINNLKLLLAEVEKNVQNIPVSPFIIEQMVRYLATLDKGNYGKYETWNKASIGDTISKVFQGSDRVKIIQDLTALSKETVYSINIPTSPLGMNNQARVNYYFNSTADAAYQARVLARSVTDDKVIDDMYLAVGTHYSKYGLGEKAKKLVDIHIAENVKRQHAIAIIASKTAKYNPALAKQYADSVKATLGSFTITNQNDANVAQIYNILISTYTTLKEINTTKQLIDTLYGKLIPAITNTDTRFTVYSRVASSICNATLNGIIPDLINAKEYSEALALIDVLHRVTKDMPKGTKETNYYNVRSLNYSVILRAYNMLYEADPSYLNIIKPKFQTVYSEYQAFNKEAASKGDQYKYYMGALGESMASIANILGLQEAESLFATFDSSTHGVRGKTSGAKDLFIAKAFKNFTEAISFYEKTIPLKTSDYSNLNGSKGYSEAFVYYGSQNGLAKQALNKNNKELALNALNYQFEKTKAAVEYAKNQKKPVKNMFYVDIASKATTYSISNNIQSKFYSASGGMEVLIRGYINAGDTAKALEAVQVGADYLNSQEVSFSKYVGYIILADFAQQLQNTTLAQTYLNEARKIITLNASNQPLLDIGLYLHRAYDVMFLNDANKLSLFTSDMGTALNKLDLVTGDDLMLSSKVKEYTYIAKVYHEFGYSNDMMKTLQKAEQIAKNIATTSHKLTAVKAIVTAYMVSGYTDESKKSAERLLTSKADITAVVKDAIENKLKMNSFDSLKYGPQVKEIAFLDTDKDGKPDFFLPTASEQDIKKSGLTLDDDIDGDGIIDTIDTLPYVKGTSAYNN